MRPIRKRTLKGQWRFQILSGPRRPLAKGAVGPDLKSVKSVLKAGDVILVQRKPVKS